jgi:hypothetical protein
MECRRENLPIEHLDVFSKVKISLRMQVPFFLEIDGISLVLLVFVVLCMVVRRTLS